MLLSIIEWLVCCTKMDKNQDSSKIVCDHPSHAWPLIGHAWTLISITHHFPFFCNNKSEIFRKVHDHASHAWSQMVIDWPHMAMHYTPFPFFCVPMCGNKPTLKIMCESHMIIHLPFQTTKFGCLLPMHG